MTMTYSSSLFIAIISGNLALLFAIPISLMRFWWKLKTLLIEHEILMHEYAFRHDIKLDELPTRTVQR